MNDDMHLPGRMDDREFALRLYQAYREKVTHEDQLVNQRMLWFVTFEALLFTSFALLTQGDFGPVAFKLTTVIFGVLGLCAAVSSLLSIGAASDAIKSTDQQWRDCLEKPKIANFFKGFEGHLPGVIGDGMNTGIIHRGGSAALSLPWFVIVGWLSLVLVVVFVTDVMGLDK